MRLPGPLYTIVDPCGRDIDPVEVAEQFLAGGARILQLRWKTATGADLIRAGREILRRCTGRGAFLIVNDRIDVALAIGAYGAHIGQEDLPTAAARTLLGSARLGVSTHDIDQAQEAAASGADYIGFGPMFPTTTKETGYEPRGLARLHEIRQAVAIPIVAIGGIGARNARDCIEAGADAVAMISELVLATDRVEAVRQVLAELDDRETEPQSRPVARRPRAAGSRRQSSSE